MNISTDIKIVKAWLDMYDALSTDAMKKESKPIFDAMYKVVAYAETCYKKEYAKDTMEQLTKILTGENEKEDEKKH